ncbi:MAG: VOC family protein [Planctomycetota bacterium]
MSGGQKFKAALPFQQDGPALPVADIEATSKWYSGPFDTVEKERPSNPFRTAILERDGTRLGFAINHGDASQAGAAILVSDIEGIKEELESHDMTIGNWRIDERDGEKLQVFFVVAPDGLCFYFHEPVQS